MTASWDYIIDEYCEVLKNRCTTLHLSEVFTELSSNEKVSFTYNLLKCDDVLPSFTNHHVKSMSKATEFRNLGNRAFIQKKDIDALRYYIKSVASAPVDSPELALAYANRSAVLFKLGQYSFSLLDVDRALNSSNYPDSLKPKLLNRKKECALKLEVERDTESIHTDVYSKLSILSEGVADSCTTVVMDHDNCESTELNLIRVDDSENKFCLPVANFRNEKIPNASEKIRVDWSPEMGRHLVASQDIRPGEILAIERPYASVLLPKFYHTHCSYCFVRCAILTPCNGCSLVMFCGNGCYQRALNSYHRTECEILSFLVSLELSKMELLALRTLLIATKQGTELTRLRTDPNFGYPFAKKRFAANAKYISRDYLAVHNLEDNYARRSVGDLFRRSAVAVILLYTLKQSSYFDVARTDTRARHLPNAKPSSISNGDELIEMETFAGTLLFKYLLTVVSNGHEVSELVERQKTSNGRINTESVEIGAALYPLLSLINHSCDPNVVRHNYGDGVVLRAIQPINRGDQLFDNYGYHYAVHSRTERLSHLSSQYFFECRCDPCRLDWPLHEHLPPGLAKCLPDKRMDLVEMQRCFQAFREGLLKPVRCYSDRMLHFLLDYLSRLHASTERPSMEYNECQEIIKHILAYRANHYTLTDIILQ